MTGAEQEGLAQRVVELEREALAVRRQLPVEADPFLEWHCGVCNTHGIIDDFADGSSLTLLSVVRTQHEHRSGGCRGRKLSLLIDERAAAVIEFVYGQGSGSVVPDVD